VRRAAATGAGILLTALTLALGAPSASALAPVVAASSDAPSASPTVDAQSPGAQPNPEPTAGAGDVPAGEGEVIRARVRTEDGTDVADVRITVLQDDELVADGTTDASGSVELVVPEAGAYDVQLDLESLAGDAAGLQPRTNPIATTVDAGNPRAVAFRLGTEAGTRAGADSIGATQVAQLVANGLRFGLIVAMAAIGLSLIFGTTGLTNFAHSELVTFGALAAYFFNTVTGLHVVVAAVLAVAASGAFGWLNDRALWQPLRRRGTGLIAMMIVSIGLSLFLRYLYLYVFGGSSRTYREYQSQAGLELWLVRLRPVDLVCMAISVVVLLVVAWALVRTRLGKATRAVSDNPALAAASGIDVDRVIRTVWITGGALAGLAGVLLGLQQGLNYQMGFQILLLVFAAVTLGGLGTAFGALVGSLVVGIFIEVSTLVVPTELKNVGALVILILILLVRPQGILGRAQRVG